jgi:HSP20 family molecular chaperone IbpA
MAVDTNVSHRRGCQFLLSINCAPRRIQAQSESDRTFLHWETAPCKSRFVKLLFYHLPRVTSMNGDKLCQEVQVNRIQPEGESVLLLKQQVDALYTEIGRRAFERFLARGGLHGYDREDWLDAERSLVFAPPAELVEEDTEFKIRIAVPGLETNQIRVSVLPHTVIVDGGSIEGVDRQEGSVRFSEFSSQRLLRCLELPAEVRTFTAKATLQDGLLSIRVKKATHADKTQQSAAAGA